MAKKLATGPLDFGDGSRNVFGFLEAKSKMCDAASGACVGWVWLESENVKWTWPLSLDLVVVAVVLANTKSPCVKLQRLQ